jgi:hypothetical protein
LTTLFGKKIFLNNSKHKTFKIIFTFMSHQNTFSTKKTKNVHYLKLFTKQKFSNQLSPMWTPAKNFSTLYHIKTFSNKNTKNNFQNLNKHTQEYCGGRKFTFQKIVNEIDCRKLACTRSESTQKGEKIVYGIARLKIKYLNKYQVECI